MGQIKHDCQLNTAKEPQVHNCCFKNTTKESWESNFSNVFGMKSSSFLEQIVDCLRAM